MPLAAVKFSELAQVVWVSLLAGVSVILLFALVVLGSARSAECRRTGRDGAATAYAGAALLAFAVFAAVVVFGVQIMLRK
ncbi:MAG TPA: hypothetical protein VH418_07815 [Solirubrobacteraceae bacterium]